MASLVPDYGESSGDSENEVSLEAHSSVSASEKSGVNYFGNGGDDDNAEDSESEDERGKSPDSKSSLPPATREPRLPTPFLPGPQSRLPTPHLNQGEGKISSSSTHLPGTSSVFANPFEQAEQAKLGILERHVRLTEAAPAKPASKQVCFKFKKGKCHLGGKCRFFHDRSNVALGTSALATGGNVEHDEEQGFAFGRGDKNFLFPGCVGGAVSASGAAGTEGRVYHPAAYLSAGQPPDPTAGDDDDNYMKAMKGKKRFGVTNNLLPPKRALTALDSHRTVERPWTVTKKK